MQALFFAKKDTLGVIFNKKNATRRLFVELQLYFTYTFAKTFPTLLVVVELRTRICF